MDEQQYMSERVEDQIAWYDRKSLSNQRWFKGLRVVELFSAASIPFLVGYANDSVYVRMAIGVLGLTVAIISGVLGLYRFEERWIGYRASCEALKHEKYLFLTRAEPYETEPRYSAFVERIERLISREHSEWSESRQAASKTGRVDPAKVTGMVDPA